MSTVDLAVRKAAGPVRTARPGRRRVLIFVAEHAVAIAVAAMFLAPFAFIVLTAVMTNTQALTPDLWPRSW